MAVASVNHPTPPRLVALYVSITTTLAVLALAAVGLSVAFGASLLVPGGGLARRAFGSNPVQPMAWAWIAATVATGGSLYFSEVMHFAPCSLCWYQRIAMYPLVVLLGIACVRRDAEIWRYVLPLASVGLLIAAYHVTIQWQPTLDAGVCSGGVPCTARYLTVFGFITIPGLAGSVFLLTVVMMLVVRSLTRADDGEDLKA